MPYKLRISNEEVENELRKMGFQNFSEEMVESFRRDLLKLIKNDLRKLKKLKEQDSSASKEFQPDYCKTKLHQPTTSTPSSYLDQEKEKVSPYDDTTSEYGSYTSVSSSERTSKHASSLASESSSKSAEEKLKSEHYEHSLVSVKKKIQRPPKVKEKKEELPAYPEKPDPVNLYHFYKAHWDKFKAPGEDPRNALRWDVRSKLFYSS